MSDTILVQRRNAIATVMLNRPDQMNAISYDMWKELASVFTSLEKDSSVRTVVLTGAGEKAFSGGADIKNFSQHRKDSEQAKEYAKAAESAAVAIENLSKPVVSMIRGFCVGGGCELALATDIRISADNGLFGIPIAKIGITVGYEEMRRLVRVVGPGNSMYLLMSARLIDARDALRIGLVSAAIPGPELEDFTYHLAENLAEYAPLSHKIQKRMLKHVLNDPSLSNTPEEDRELPLEMFDSQDFKEGVKAFIEKRKPQFRGL